jgi:phage shock protein PspC (stress-responsive transcriptional regulator)
MLDVNDQRFYRSTNRILGGVCAGVAEGFHIDALWVRVAFLLLVFLQGVGIFLYVVLWLVMPERVEGDGQRSGFDAMTSDVRRIWGDVQRQFGSTPQPATSPGGQPASVPAAPSPQAHAAWHNQSVVFGLMLVVIGLGLLASNVGIINWSVVWPAALITLGIVILVRNLERRP